jgi:two-component system OmpR family response regulator
VLVVGTEPRVAPIVAALRGQGCTVHVGDAPARVAEYCDAAWPEAVVIDGVGSARDAALGAVEWARRSANLPVLLMTEPADVEARLRSLALRADDTVAPTAPEEIVGRVAAMVRQRRTQRPDAQPLGDLSIDREGRRVTRQGNAAGLTQRELDVLEVLVERPGRVVSKEELLARVWPDKGRTVNAVEAQISGLRRKLDAMGPPVIHTAHGEGYAFRPVTAKEGGGRPPTLDLAERERLVREREQAVARRADLLRQLEDEVARRAPILRRTERD